MSRIRKAKKKCLCIGFLHSVFVSCVRGLNSYLPVWPVCMKVCSLVCLTIHPPHEIWIGLCWVRCIVMIEIWLTNTPYIHTLAGFWGAYTASTTHKNTHTHHHRCQPFLKNQSFVTTQNFTYKRMHLYYAIHSNVALCRVVHIHKITIMIIIICLLKKKKQM